jgi:hypothetical protein
MDGKGAIWAFDDTGVDLNGKKVLKLELTCGKYLRFIFLTENKK